MILISGYSGAPVAPAEGAFQQRSAPAPDVTAAKPAPSVAETTDVGASDDVDTNERHDPDVLTGPTPAFQASLLELERDLQATIARLEAARTAQRVETTSAPRAVQAPAPEQAPALATPEVAQPEPDAAADSDTFALEVPYDLGAAATPKAEGPA